MRILQLGKFYPIQGGVEKVAYDLTAGLSERGVDCDMMCAALQGGSRIIPVNAHANVICCHAWTKAAATMISPAMIFTFRRVCGNYDIVHVHHPDPMACMALFLSGYKGKVVLHWHADILKQKTLLKLYKPFQSWLVRRADVIVGTTLVYLRESPFLEAVQSKTRCLPIGVPPVEEDAEGARRIKEFYGGRKIVFSLGRLIGYKGYRYLVDSARYLTDDFVILIGGTGPLHDELENQIRVSGLEDRVKLLGFVSDDLLPAYYSACDVFCLSSVQKTEAFGIVQIEAMSCGKPVVATNIPQSGVPWVNEHGVSGLNVPPCDSQALAEAIVSVTADPAVYQRYAAGARKRYCSLFTKERMIEKCLNIYYYE